MNKKTKQMRHPNKTINWSRQVFLLCKFNNLKRFYKVNVNLQQISDHYQPNKPKLSCVCCESCSQNLLNIVLSECMFSSCHVRVSE